MQYKKNIRKGKYPIKRGFGDANITSVVKLGKGVYLVKTRCGCCNYLMKTKRNKKPSKYDGF